MKDSRVFNIANIIIWGMICIYVAIFFYLCSLKYYAFGYFDWDYASDLTILWNSVHGRLLYYPFLEENIFGAHLCLIILPIILIYKLFQHPLTLLFLQSLFLGLAAYPLYLFTASKINKFFACVVSLTYLLYPSIGFINLFETHFDIYAIFFLFFTILYFEKEHFKKFIIFILLALSCKENVSLAVFMFGFYAWLRRKPLKWIVTPFLLGLGWFLLSVKVVIPHFAKDAKLYQEGFMFSIYYSHLGRTIPEMLQTILLHPGMVLHFAFSAGKVSYPFLLFLPTGFLGLLSPGVLLMTLPIFAQNLLSSIRAHSCINYHYVALLVPFIFVCAVWGLKKILSMKSVYPYRYLLAAVFLLNSVITGFILKAPQLRLKEYIKLFSLTDGTKEKERLVRMIPREASVMASFQFLPHLANRKEIYSLHLLSMGYRMYTNARYIPPEGLEYLLADFNDSLLAGSFFPPDAPANIRNFLQSGSWRVWEARDDMVLFKKGEGQPEALCQTVSQSDVQNKFNINFADQVAFLGYDLIKEPDTAGRTLHFVFYWKRLGDGIPPLGLFLQFLGPNGEIVFQKAHSLGYKIYPLDAFSKDEIIREHYYADVPRGRFEAGYDIGMNLFILATGRSLPINQKAQASPTEMVLLGRVN